MTEAGRMTASLEVEGSRGLMWGGFVRGVMKGEKGEDKGNHRFDMVESKEGRLMSYTKYPRHALDARVMTTIWC